MRLINTPRVVGYPTLEECAAAYPLFMIITRSFYVKEHGEGPGERNIPRYVRGYVFQKSKWYPCFASVDGDFYMDYEPFVWEKHEYALPQPADYKWHKEMEENYYGS